MNNKEKKMSKSVLYTLIIVVSAIVIIFGYIFLKPKNDMQAEEHNNANPTIVETKQNDEQSDEESIQENQTETTSEEDLLIGEEFEIELEENQATDSF